MGLRDNFDRNYRVAAILKNDKTLQQKFEELFTQYHFQPCTGTFTTDNATLIYHGSLPDKSSVFITPKEYQQLLNLLENTKDDTTKITSIPATGRNIIETSENAVVVSGMSGMGKTLLVAEIVRKLLTRKSYDIICWINMGISNFQEPKQQQWQQEYIHNCFVALANQYSQQVTDVSQAFDAIFENKPALVVIDDVWDHIENLPHKSNIKFLFTTRRQNLTVNKLTPRHINLSSFDEESSTSLFLTIAKIPLHNKEAITKRDNIIKKCRGLPLAITLIANHAEFLLRFDGPSKVYETLETEFTEIIFNKRETLFARFNMTVQNSLNMKEKVRLNNLIIFPDDKWIHQEVFLLLWTPELPRSALPGTDSVFSVLDSLFSLSLIEKRTENNDNYYRIHYLVKMYLQELITNEDQQASHHLLVNKYIASLKYPKELWSGVLDSGGYLLENLELHLQIVGNKRAKHCFALTQSVMESWDWLEAQFAKSTTIASKLRDQALLLCAKHKENQLFWRNILHKVRNEAVWGLLCRYYLPEKGYSCDVNTLIEQFWKIAKKNPRLIDLLLSDKLYLPTVKQKGTDENVFATYLNSKVDTCVCCTLI